MQKTKQNIEEIIKSAEKNLQEQFENLEQICLSNQKKVLDAFRDNRIAEEHFHTVSGYGHDDMGREAIDKTFAQIFKAEKAIVRPHFVSGTHALACALFGNLRYGEKLISIAGRPYDTMEEVIGLRGNKRASLAGHGVQYDEIPLIDGLHIDFDGIEKTVDKNTNMVLIQRSRGYSLRDPITIEMMERIINIVKSKNPDCICFVDNCYGEFT
ncbi:MAG: methionine gamma-lyase family protein, partial [Candidatus Gastranaerophilales bacterium]|nr:methionine gamma-lyase family protein [Candidatus Gastranaerophilales bacterium]